MGKFQRLAAATAVVLATVIGALALWQMREAVQLLLVSIAVAAGLRPVIDWLIEHGLSRVAAIAGTFITTLVLLVLGLVLLGSLASAELALLLESLPQQYERLRQWLSAGTNWAERLGQALPNVGTLTTAVAQSNDAVSLLLTAATRITIGAALIISVGSLGFYWLLEQQRIERLWLSLLPLSARTMARTAWEQIYHEVGIYVRGEAAIVTLTTFALLSIYTLLDLPGAAILALLGGLAMVVPLLGGPLMLLPGALVAFAQGVQTGSVALASALYVLLVVRLIIARRAFHAGITVNPVLVIVLIMALAELGGLWMILFAPPLAAAWQATLRALIGEQRTQTAQERPLRIDTLQARLSVIERQLDESEPNSPLRDMISRTRSLLTEAEEVVEL